RAPHQRTVAAPLRARFAGVGAGELGVRAGRQVAHEDVAVAHEGHARAPRIERLLFAVDAGQRGAVAARGRAAFDRLRERVADVAAVALARVVGVLAVPRPPCVLDAGADPVG